MYKKLDFKILIYDLLKNLLLRVLNNLYFLHQKLFVNPGYVSAYNYLLYLKYRNKKIPFRHVASLDSLLFFTNSLNKAGINVFLREGALLGAVRQGAFAGRPADIDLFIKADDLKKLSELFAYFQSHRYRIVKKMWKSKINFFPPRGCKIDVFYYRAVIIDDKEIFIRHIDEKVGVTEDIKNNSTMSIEKEQLLNPDIAYLYGYPFLIPSDPEKILEKLYGANWRIPTSRQYAWRI